MPGDGILSVAFPGEIVYTVGVEMKKASCAAEFYTFFKMIECLRAKEGLLHTEIGGKKN